MSGDVGALHSSFDGGGSEVACHGGTLAVSYRIVNMLLCIPWGFIACLPPRHMPHSRRQQELADASLRRENWG